jgi:hypothetical protein
MYTKKVKNIFDFLSHSPVNSVFLLYSVFFIIIICILVFLIHKPMDFFLKDDGYYTLGKLFFDGKISLAHQYRGPGFLLLFASFNYFPEYMHPYLRLIVTFAFIYANLLIASNLFDNILTRKQIFIGLLISVFNPVFIHFTIKSTPEIYLILFLGLIILFYKKFVNELKIKNFVVVLFVVVIATFFKPVFFIIPALLFFHCIIMGKFKKLIISLIIFIIVALAANISFSKYTKFYGKNSKSYGIEDVLVPTFIPVAIMKTGELNMGTKVETLQSNQDQSNYLIGFEYFKNWLSKYYQENEDSSEIKLVYYFIKENYLMFFFVKIISPVMFISFASSTEETILCFFINIIFIYLSIVSIKRVFKKYKSDILIILFSLLGYAFVFFLSFSYIRYSVPFMFYFSIFIGILYKSDNNRIENKK